MAILKHFKAQFATINKEGWPRVLANGSFKLLSILDELRLEIKGFFLPKQRGSFLENLVCFGGHLMGIRCSSEKGGGSFSRGFKPPFEAPPVVVSSSI